ncbi:MAG: hypothetical protein JF589_02765 [Gemmatimonadetes bacterium]|nr:hypothetical protein [Gemmatimonadota bacterium]
MSATRTMDWTEEGRRIGVTLDAFHAVIVVGVDATAAAEVALGIARVQAVHRRVAVGDLLGEAPPLQALVTGENPHGLVDSFQFGVSLTRIAQQVPDAGELFVMPTGTSPPDYDEIFTNTRWRRLIAGFREVGALLIICAPADAPHVHDLVDVSDGVVIVGDTVPPEVSVAQSLAWIRPRRAAPAPSAEPAAAEAVPAASRAAVAAPAGGGSGRPRWLVPAALAALLLIVLIWGLDRYTQHRLQERAAADSAARALAERVRITDSIARVRRDSIVSDSLTRLEAGGAGVDSFPVYAPANPGDSANAAGYAVLLTRFNARSSAIMDLNGHLARLPAATYGIESPSRLYQSIVGAFPTRAAAESLLAQLRARRTVAQGFGSVDNFPLAFLVDSGVPPREATARLTRYAARGLPVYGLRQPNGAVRFYYGAYMNPEQAALAVPGVREAGIKPLLVYRIGRVF